MNELEKPLGVVHKCELCKKHILNDDQLGWHGRLFGRELYICVDCLNDKKVEFMDIVRRLRDGIEDARGQV